MSMPKLSIITPTCGRPSLLAAVGCVNSQIGLDDEHIIVHDSGDYRFGNPQRDEGIARAKGDYIVFLDDDDLLMPDALLSIKEAVAKAPEPIPHMFSVYHIQYGRCLNKTITSRDVDVCGSRLVVPNNKEKMPKWDNPLVNESLRHSQQEFAFIEAVLALYPGSPVWVDKITHIIPAASVGKLPNG